MLSLCYIQSTNSGKYCENSVLQRVLLHRTHTRLHKQWNIVDIGLYLHHWSLDITLQSSTEHKQQHGRSHSAGANWSIDVVVWLWSGFSETGWSRRVAKLVLRIPISFAAMLLAGLAMKAYTASVCLVCGYRTAIWQRHEARSAGSGC